MVKSHRVARVIVAVQHGACQEQWTHGKKPIFKSCDDPEVAAAAAYCPKQVGVFGCACFQQSAVRGHDFRSYEIVAGQPVFAAELAEPSPERQPGYAGVSLTPMVVARP